MTWVDVQRAVGEGDNNHKKGCDSAMTWVEVQGEVEEGKKILYKFKGGMIEKQKVLFCFLRKTWLWR